MKKAIFIILVFTLLIAAVICFFPFTRNIAVEGAAEVLSLDKEKIGTCQLRVEVNETRSLLLNYNRRFNFSIDSKDYIEFESSSDDELNGVYFISQMFYNAEKDYMENASLICPWNFTYAAVRMDGNIYYLDNGARLSPADLPIAFLANK